MSLGGVSIAIIIFSVMIIIVVIIIIAIIIIIIISLTHVNHPMVGGRRAIRFIRVTDRITDEFIIIKPNNFIPKRDCSNNITI